MVQVCEQPTISLELEEEHPKADFHPKSDIVASFDIQGKM